jgi:hypothetical protein
MSGNSAKGRNSFDIETETGLVNFFNRNSTPYPTEVGAPKFDLVPVKEQKDIMLNVSKLYAKQEYDRIMQMVDILQKQAFALKRRIDISDWVHSAEYKFQVYHDHPYWIAFDKSLNKNVLLHLGPNDWASSHPDKYEYLAKVKLLGDYTWVELDENGDTIE